MSFAHRCLYKLRFPGIVYQIREDQLLEMAIGVIVRLQEIADVEATETKATVAVVKGLWQVTIKVILEIMDNSIANTMGHPPDKVDHMVVRLQETMVRQGVLTVHLRQIKKGSNKPKRCSNYCRLLPVEILQLPCRRQMIHMESQRQDIHHHLHSPSNRPLHRLRMLPLQQLQQQVVVVVRPHNKYNSFWQCLQLRMEEAVPLPQSLHLSHPLGPATLDIDINHQIICNIVTFARSETLVMAKTSRWNARLVCLTPGCTRGSRELIACGWVSCNNTDKEQLGFPYNQNPHKATNKLGDNRKTLPIG